MAICRTGEHRGPEGRGGKSSSSAWAEFLPPGKMLYICSTNRSKAASRVKCLTLEAGFSNGKGAKACFGCDPRHSWSLCSTSSLISLLAKSAFSTSCIGLFSEGKRRRCCFSIRCLMNSGGQLGRVTVNSGVSSVVAQPKTGSPLKCCSTSLSTTKQKLRPVGSTTLGLASTTCVHDD